MRGPPTQLLSHTHARAHARTRAHTHSCHIRRRCRRSVLSLPLGLGLNFVINGEPIDAVPMAVEEPSVIAATSGAAKLVAAGGGFETATTASAYTAQYTLPPPCPRDTHILALARDRES